MTCHVQIRQDRALDGQHQFSFKAAPEGYNAVCLACGMAFRSAVEWVGTRCEPKKKEGPA